VIYKQWVFLMLFLCMGFYPVYGEEAEIEDHASNQRTSLYLRDLITYAAGFRDGIVTNYSESLDYYVSPDIAPWFDEFKNTPWAGIAPEILWQRFFLDSQIVVTNIKNRPLVIYYSVWPDVYIITAWQEKEGKFKINDAEIVSGDFFRIPQSEQIQATPLWSRSTRYLLSSIENSISVSLKKGDRAFLNNKSRAWRSAGGLEDAVDNRRLRKSRSVARENVLSNLTNIYNFYYSKQNNVENVRSVVYEVQSAFYLDLWDSLYDEDVVGKQVEKYVNGIDKEFFLDARVVATVTHAKGVWAFITIKGYPQISLSIQLLLDKGGYKVNKIDVIDYTRAYSNG